MRRGLRGFTMLEVLLSVALLGVIAGMGIPVFQSFQARNDLDIAAITVAASLRRAQVLSVASDGDSSWGVRVATSTLTLFKGNSYASRDSTYDEDFGLSAAITVAGVGEIVFAKLSGVPNATGTTTLTSTTQEVRNIYVNAKGTITY